MNQVKNNAIWLGYNFPKLEYSMGNFVNPIGLNFDDEKLIRLDKDKFTKYFNFKMQQVTVTTDRGIVIRTKSDSYIDLSSFDMITLPYNPTA